MKKSVLVDMFLLFSGEDVFKNVNVSWLNWFMFFGLFNDFSIISSNFLRFCFIAGFWWDFNKFESFGGHPQALGLAIKKEDYQE